MPAPPSSATAAALQAGPQLDQPPQASRRRERRRLVWALALSLAVHTLLLALTFDGQEPGLPGLALPWQQRRGEAPLAQGGALHVVLLPPRQAPASAAGTGTAAAVAASQAAGLEEASVLSVTLAPPPDAAAAEAVPEAVPEVAPDVIAVARRPDDTLRLAVAVPTLPTAAAAAASFAASAAPAAPQPARPDDARLQAEQQEAAQAEAARAEAERQQAARLAAERQASAAQASAKLEAARQEAVRQEAARQETARLDAERQDTLRQEAARQQAALAEAARQEAARQAALKQQAAQQQQQEAAARQDAARAEAARAEAQRLDAARQAAAAQEAARLQPALDAEARRQATLRAIGRQLDEEAARREAAVSPARPPGTLPPSASTLRRGRLFGRADPDAELVLYAEAWARKIQLNMTFDTVRELVTRPYTNPLVTVAIRSDGSVEAVTFVLSSGVPALDDAVRRIVQGQAPYPAFSPALARSYDVIEIRRTWYFDMAVRLY